jgi:hypothetical protein
MADEELAPEIQRAVEKWFRLCEEPQVFTAYLFPDFFKTEETGMYWHVPYLGMHGPWIPRDGAPDPMYFVQVARKMADKVNAKRVVLVSEGWRSETAKSDTWDGTRPSLDPNRTEVLTAPILYRDKTNATMLSWDIQLSGHARKLTNARSETTRIMPHMVL